MKIAFCLYKYFPFGGLQRDMLTIAEACRQRGHEVTIFAGIWESEKPADMRVVEVTCRGLSNDWRNADFVKQVRAERQRSVIDCMVGFNKMPGLDLYYAADSCYRAKALEQRSFLYRLTPRCRHLMAYEKAVFDPHAATQILALSDREAEVYRRYYQTPQERFHALPPNIRPDRKYPANGAVVREQFRQAYGLSNDQFLLLMVGSSFRTKGVDRALRAVAALPDVLRKKTWLMVVGDDNPAPFTRLVDSLGLQRSVRFFSGRDDVNRFLLGADALIHPAYRENTGTVLLEAAVAGLPVLAAGTCGFSHHIVDHDMGLVTAEPFQQEQLNALLEDMFDDSSRSRWRANGIKFSAEADIFSMPQRAADIIDSYARS